VLVALGIQHAMRMRRIVISGLSGCTIFFFTLSHKRHDSRKKILNIKRVLWFYLNHFSFQKKNWTIYDQKSTGLFKMIVGVLTTCHTQYTW